MDLSQIPTCDLFNELKEREGVRAFPAPDPEYEYEIHIWKNGEYKAGTTKIEGPATILEVID